MTRPVSPHAIRLSRAYDPPGPDDGTRVLADRLWPRGVTKAALAIDRWPREIAPSDELRRWLHADPARWPDFGRRYRAELESHAGELTALRSIARQGTLTLVFAAKDIDHNNAVVLRDVLLSV